jgi:hypothetical protein
MHRRWGRSASVARKKNPVALFEAIAKSREKRREEGLGVPGWIGGQPAQPGRKPPPPPSVPPPPRAQAAAPPAAAGPMVSRGDGRIRLSVPTSTAVIALVGVLALLTLAFLLGRWTKGTRVPVAEAGTGAPSKAPSQTAPKTGGAAAVEPVAGKFYLVIQRLGNSADDRLLSTRMAKWCTEHGHPAGPYYDEGRGHYFVASLKPFDAPQGQANLEYARQIEALGGKYFTELGTYNFRQPRDARGRLDPVFRRLK